MADNFVAFSILATILVLIPGLDFTLVVKYATTKSKKSAVAVMLGITSGLFVWGAFASLGVSAILQTSEFAFNALKIAGVLYMLWMGVGFIWNSFKKSAHLAAEPTIKSDKRVFTRGLLSNLLNPKAGVFYISVLPQFIPTATNHLLAGLVLTSIHAVITIIYFGILIYLIDFFKTFFARPTVVRNLERFSGIAVIGFGAKLLLSQQH